MSTKTNARPVHDLNVSVLAGTLSRPPALRTLPSGDQLLELQVTTRTAEATETVPVSWSSPRSGAVDWPAGTEVIVVGRVRRRFFRAGGATASRTEVVAAEVLRPSQRRSVARCLAEAAAAIGP